jgi:hypothetical protein
VVFKKIVVARAKIFRGVQKYPASESSGNA